ncbi:MAG: TetR/AcrR family transcriptional regulator [Kineosporiaceae bacterium]
MRARTDPVDAPGGPARPGRPARRRPQQARSRARVRAILDAAEHILTTDGASALTVRRLAAEAGVPVGTLYQFFPDKQAVVDELAHRYLDEFAALTADLVARAERERWDDPVGTLIDAFADAYRTRPAYLAIWTGPDLSPPLRHADEANNALIADGVRRVLVAQLGLPDDTGLLRAAQVAVQVADALLRHAFRDGADGDPHILTELTRLLRLYLADLLNGNTPPAAPGTVP